MAVGWAANAVGTINDVQEAIRLAHDVGAVTFIDAVHYAPHGHIDVKAIDTDFLACSSYKFFGPHQGILYVSANNCSVFAPTSCASAARSCPTAGRPVRRTTNAWPESPQPSTTSPMSGATTAPRSTPGARLVAAYEVFQQHERELAGHLISGLLAIPGLTFTALLIRRRSISARRRSPFAWKATPHANSPTRLGERGIFTWDGNYYAINLAERLGVQQSGGMLRIGLAHYNTEEEVQRLLMELRELAAKVKNV